MNIYQFTARLISCCALVCSVLVAEPATEAKEIYTSIMSPYCPGRTLQDCPSTAANQLKSEILVRLEKGETKDQILDTLVEKYGKEISAIPAMRGFAALAWIMPIVFLLSGVIYIGIKVSRKNPAKL